MTANVLRRDPWTGKAQQLGDLLLMRKNSLQARCELWTHLDGWECRLYAGDEEMVAQQVCRSQDEVFTFRERWEEALKAQGWRTS